MLLPDPPRSPSPIPSARADSSILTLWLIVSNLSQFRTDQDKSASQGKVTIISGWSGDGWWVAELAEVPGMISQDRIKEEARTDVLNAANEFLTYCRDLASSGA